MGAWIETSLQSGLCDYIGSHPVWVRGLKQVLTPCVANPPASHPVWVRGLKPMRVRDIDFVISSHPVWVRGLKLVLFAAQFLTDGRTPCGCVD